METLQSNIEVWTFLQYPQTEWGFVYEIKELLGDSRTTVSVFPYGATRISHPDVRHGEVTDIPASMVHQLKVITRKHAEKLIEVIS